MKLIITEGQFEELIKEELISPPEIPNTMSFWHGGNLHDNYEAISQKRGRYEYGPGLYLITKYDEAIKYTKGQRKLYMVTVSVGNDLSSSYINVDAAKEFINKYIIPNKKNQLIKIIDNNVNPDNKVNPNNSINGNIFNNIIINYDAIKSSNTKYLRKFYIDNNIDYNIVYNPFGWGEKMMVLFNMRKIVNIKRIFPKDKISQYDL